VTIRHRKLYTPASPPPKPPSLSKTQHRIDHAFLRQLSAYDLRTVFDAITDANRAIVGVLNRPRVNDETRPRGLTPGGEEVDRLCNYLDWYQQAVRNAARDLVPSDGSEARERAVLLLHDLCGLQEDWTEILAQANRCQADVEKLEPVQDPVDGAIDTYAAARDAFDRSPEDDEVPANNLFEKEEAVARTIPTTRAGAERMVDTILKANEGFKGIESLAICMRSLAAAIK